MVFELPSKDSFENSYQVDASKHTMAKYLMELTIIEYDMVQYYPSEIAAAALCLSMKLLDGTKWVRFYASLTCH